jgi:hypothetical protein
MGTDFPPPLQTWIAGNCGDVAADTTNWIEALRLPNVARQPLILDDRAE